MNTRHLTITALALSLGLSGCSGSPDSEGTTTDAPGAPPTSETRAARPGVDMSPGEADTSSSVSSGASSTARPSDDSTRAPGPSAWPSASPYPSPDKSATPRAVVSPSKVDREKPESVAKAFLTNWWGSDFRADADRMDAVERAAKLATPKYRDVLLDPAQPAPAPRWNLLHAERGYAKVSVKPSNDDLPDSRVADKTEALGWELTVTYPGTDLPAETFQTMTVLEATDQGWAVSSMMFS